MTESFLHYIWQHRLFDTQKLVSDDGSNIEILKSGIYNTGAGPDFFNAQLRLDGIVWAGNVEIHINSSDWQKHNHQCDPAYDSCILHVVNKCDTTTFRMNGSVIPTLEIGTRFPPHLWNNYLKLIGTQDWIACQPRLGEVDKNLWKQTIDLMIAERMERRCSQIYIALQGNKGDWQETFYQHLARNFGFQINAVPFEMLARSLPGSIVFKEHMKLFSIESLLFGQAGMLENNFSDTYAGQLQSEYYFLSRKYKLTGIPFSAWKFLRLRPVNFPTIRIAQFAALLHKSPVLFNEVIQSKFFNSIFELFNVTASEYWDSHYQFDHPSVHKIKRLGGLSVNNILINTCIPFIYAWGKYTGDVATMNHAMDLLAQLPAEDNNLIARWRQSGVIVENAVDTQALLQLKILHCSEKKCLTCLIGNKLIKIQS